MVSGNMNGKQRSSNLLEDPINRNQWLVKTSVNATIANVCKQLARMQLQCIVRL